MSARGPACENGLSATKQELSAALKVTGEAARRQENV